MVPDLIDIADPRVQHALIELTDMISETYPDATYTVSRAEDEPEMIHLYATVDLEDTDEVVKLVLDKMFDLQVEQRLPIHVIPLRPLERVLAYYREHPSHYEPVDLSIFSDIG